MHDIISQLLASESVHLASISRSLLHSNDI